MINFRRQMMMMMMMMVMMMMMIITIAVRMIRGLVCVSVCVYDGVILYFSLESFVQSKERLD